MACWPVGKSPAFDVLIDIWPYVWPRTKDPIDKWPGGGPLKVQKDSCANRKARTGRDWDPSQIVFSNNFVVEAEKLEFTINQEGSDISKQLPISDHYMFFILGCLTYKYGEQNMRHQTGFV